jgi:hypothetical protein
MRSAAMKHGPVAQGIEHLPSKQRVEGSNPSGITIKIKYLY